ncbi:MAG: UDP-N-acetylmuramate dehydrogenase [Actinomycetota bacterium]|nr:UDP-N-acetylmuramate dehydrogenase [Actinomycetota bacterium]MDQ3681010.1 UDP-N-acetylmuramate dehydrogenase [Actinomycetota bacterium]
MNAVERAAAVLGPKGRHQVPLGPLTTYRVGGAAALLLVVESEADLELAREAVTSSGVGVLVVGRGSNLLVADAGFPGLAVVLAGLDGVIVEAESRRARGEAGALLPVLARRTAAAGLTGLEWAVGVPGSVGGAVRMNAGGHGADVARTLVRYRFVDLMGGDDGVFGPERLGFGYRRSTVAAHHVVVWAEFGLAPGDRSSSEARIADIVRWRREHQPGGQNAGSVFTNPTGDSAGRIIDAAGLKGLRRGSAQVSVKHANFIQVDDGGSADDVMALIGDVQGRVLAETGVRLKPEVRLVGFDVEALSPDPTDDPTGASR